MTSSSVFSFGQTLQVNHHLFVNLHRIIAGVDDIALVISKKFKCFCNSIRVKILSVSFHYSFYFMFIEFRNICFTTCLPKRLVSSLHGKYSIRR